MEEKITSWKKERYRRQKIFNRIKLRRQLAKDLETWTRNLIRSQNQVQMFTMLEKRYERKDNI